MVELKNISIFELKSFVSISYSGDKELLEKYHVEEYETEEQAVNSTMNMIRMTSEEVDMKCYSVFEEKEAIGYLCVFDNFLYSFGIKKEKRKMPILVDFWANILDILGSSFITMLYPNNVRAINWLRKCGMVEVKEVETNCVTLLNV